MFNEQDVDIYLKVPFTTITTNIVVKNTMPIKELFDLVNSDCFPININKEYSFELVDTGKQGDEIAEKIIVNDETLIQRYGLTSLLSFYIRPIYSTTGEILRNYDNLFQQS